jgi:hypothetical protein
MRIRAIAVATSLALPFAAPLALAQPAPQPAPVDPSKMDAKALMQTGVRLLEAKDYLGALAIFRDAYARFPSAKILLNIGTTLKLLDRKAEAANTYQRYLDSADADAAKKAQVTAEIAELDKAVGVVEVTVVPEDAEIKLGSGEWMPAAQAKQYRVAPGEVVVDARKTGYLSGTQTSTVAAGARVAVSLSLNEVPKQSVTVVDDGLAPIEIEKPRSRIGALAIVHVSVLPKLGSAALVGATVDVIPQLAVDAAVLLGPGLVSDGMATRPPPSFGGYVGASYAFLPGKLRPRAGAGMTLFSSDGVRLQARGAGGVEYVATRNLSAIIEIGAEVPLNPEDDIRELAIVPSVAVSGRL